MKNKVIYIIKSELHLFPPCVSHILSLHDLGIEVLVLFSDCDKVIKELFDSRGIKYITITAPKFSNSTMGKALTWLSFSLVAKKQLSKYCNAKDIIFLGTADTAGAMIWIKKKNLYIISVLELYDTFKLYQKILKYLSSDAVAVICCELNRAKLMKRWWGLEKLPYVMPNKPYLHPRIKNLRGSTVQTKDMITQICNKKVILYQGYVSSDRDIAILAKALAAMHCEYILVMMGRTFENQVQRIQNIYANSIYLGYVPAPLHLEITSHAYIGVAIYNDSSLNDMFCAPNKIYEYAGFGIPMICSDNPGLVGTIGIAGAGECVNCTDVNAVKAAIENEKK